MGPLKSLGPYGFNVGFFQIYWHIVGPNVCIVALKFLKEGHMDIGINYTYLVFIPKITNSSTAGDYCQISLCNVVYKLVSKVLANRLKKIISFIILENHSTFIPGKLIFDNVIFASESLHIMGEKQKSKEWHMTIKLDISKTYDRIEWNYLEMIMSKIGFVAQWIHKIMSYVSTVSYSVMISGHPGTTFLLGRGLR